MHFTAKAIAIIVVDDTSDPALLAETREVLASRPNARHVLSPETASLPFTIGRLRDRGALEAEDGHIMFHDVDFTAPRRCYRRLLAWIDQSDLATNRKAFACVPVAFLTAGGTAAYVAAPGRTWTMLATNAARTAGFTQRTVYGSSAIVLHRRRLLEIGGHNPAFVGHGAEDFELLHRLTVDYPQGPRPDSYHVDQGSRSRSRQGFRAYFGRYGAPLHKAGIHLVHLWHPARREDARYYQHKRQNFALLEQLLRDEAERTLDPGMDLDRPATVSEP